MAVYNLCQNVTAVQTVSSIILPGRNAAGGSNMAVDPRQPSGSETPATYQSFQVTVTGSGSVSASAQVVASNDGVNWITIGSVISPSGNNSGTAGGNASSPYKWWSAYVTAISGTNASVNVNMCA